MPRLSAVIGAFRPSIVSSLCVLTGLSVGAVRAAESPFIVTPDHPTGVYAPNEQVTWTIDAKGDRTALTSLPYKVRKDAQVEVVAGTIDLSKGPVTISATRTEPGALLAEIFSMDKTQQLPVAMGGAVFAPAKIVPAKPAPEDFDLFWQSKLRELALVPPNPLLEKAAIETIKNTDGTDCYKVTLDNIRGTHVRGVLARPTKEGKLPAMLMVNSAGVSDLDKASVIAQAKPGWLVLNVSAHDLPLDEPADCYKNLKETTLKNYYAIGNEDRETSYFLRMILGCVRGAEYLASRPDWDHKVRRQGI